MRSMLRNGQQQDFEAILQFGELVAAIVAALALARTAQSTYARTIGRRRSELRKLGKLGTNAHLSYFVSVLEGPPAISRTLPHRRSRDRKEHIFISKAYFVQAITDNDQTVLAYSVTSRSKRFHPRLVSPGFTRGDPGLLRRLGGREDRRKRIFDVRLQRTPFIEISRPSRVCANVAARRYRYWEEHKLGNPGHYQRYRFSVNDAAPTKGNIRLLVQLVRNGFDGERQLNFDDESEAQLKDQNLTSLRADVSPNTYTVIGPSSYSEEFPQGPDEDHVRTLLY